MSAPKRTIEETLPFTIKVQLEQTQNQELPKGMVYAYDRNGGFLTSTSFPDKAQFTVQLSLPSVLHGETIRLLIGPELSDYSGEMPEWMRRTIRLKENNAGAHSSSLLLRKGAYEQQIQLDDENKVVPITVSPHDWKKWRRCRCVVRGRLIKILQMPDGTHEELGVCNACIRIYEVDKLSEIIARLPDRDLSRIRDDLLVHIKSWSPAPLKKIPFLIRPKSGPPPSQACKPEDIRSVPAKVSTAETAHVTMSQEPPPPPPDKNIPSRRELPAAMIAQELQNIFTAASANQLRNALIIKADILAKLMCQWKWLHFHFSKDLIKCVPTNGQGRFKTTITYPRGGDKPDLYFKGIQCIGYSMNTLYDPSVACNTHWNYECGREVVLVTKDPAANTRRIPEPVQTRSKVTNLIMPYAMGGTLLNKNNHSINIRFP